MSTSPEDRIVALLSRWLARHLDNAELLAAIRATGHEGLTDRQAEALGELLAVLERAARTERGGVEMAVRETLEALALG